MRKLIAVFLLAAFAALATEARATVVIPWSRVGNPGNAADSVTDLGDVPYAYNIATYDVTASQYVQFLNARDGDGLNPLRMYNTGMSDPTFGGINFTAGNLPGSKYSVIAGRGDHPANFVNWFNAVRFANWLNNGQGNGDTESGAYTVLGGTPVPSNFNSIARNAGATVFIPSLDEWYKAAYFDPGTSSYFLYPTSSNTPPTASGTTALPNHANFSPGGPDNLTDVGAYTGTTSPYGAFDVGGNIFQWNEASSGTSRRALGGAFNNNSDAMLSTHGFGFDPASKFSSIGFRVASDVPEPSTWVLAVIACGVMWWWSKRFK